MIGFGAIPSTLADSTRCGTYHCVAGGETSWFGFAQHVINTTAGKTSAQIRNDAEAAAVVAAFGDFEIRVMFGG